MINASPLWYKDAVFYQVYVRAFCDSNGDGHGDFPGLTSKLDYLAALGVDCLWIMPMYQSPLLDDGYDISDYYAIHPDYGTLDDFKTFLDEAHQRGLRVIVDLVLNHTSDQHVWFQSARADPNSPYRDYYVWSDSDQKYQGVRIIFLDVESANWSFDEKAGQYFWHRFYASQPDLNWDNPEVEAEMMNVVRFWLSQGVDGFRADAVPYLIEREDTTCENLPETHAILKRLRAMMDGEFPGSVLLCEANMWPEDVRPYFGVGDEFQMGFHFPIMPRMYMSLRKGDASDMLNILNRTPEIPPECQWVIFLRNHDELTLEMVTESERQWMWEQYAPEPRMRLNLGIRRRLAPLLDNDIRKIILMNAMLFTLPGSPIIYYGDEIGMGDDIWQPDRNGVRTPMQWNAAPGMGFSDSPESDWYLPASSSPAYHPEQVNVVAAQKDQGSLWQLLRKMIDIRKSCLAFGRGSFEWAASGETGAAAYWRVYNEQTILCAHNLRAEAIRLTIAIPQELGEFEILLGDQLKIERQENAAAITLPPYGMGWVLFR